MCNRAAAFAALLAVSAATVTAAPPAATPTPHPPTATSLSSPRDPASSQATGKRTHMPIRERAYYDQTVPLKDGRVFLLNSKTGEVEFGDGAKGKIPEPAGVPVDGTYFLPDGTPCRIKGGKLVKTPPPTKTPVKGGGAAGNAPK